jgi:hypothetical protein
VIEWAKVYTDILGDPKLMRAARKGLKGLELAPWFITFAKSAADDGRLSVGGEPAEPADFVNLIPGQRLRSIAAALRSLETIGVLVRDPADDCLRFAAWQIRQERAPSDSPEAVRERVRQHRARQRNARSNGVGNAGTVTDETSGNETEERREEEESEEKRRDTSPSPSPQAASDRLRAALPEKNRPDLDALLDRVSNRTAWVGELTMAVEGGTAGAGVSYERLGEAIHDFLLNGKGEVPEIALLRGYIKRAVGAHRSASRPLSLRPRGSGGAPSTARPIRSVL